MRQVIGSLVGFLLYLWVFVGAFLFVYAAAENNIALKAAVILGGLIVIYLTTIYREHKLAKQAYLAVTTMLLFTALVCFMMGVDLMLKAAYWYLTTSVFDSSYQHDLLAEYRLGFYAPLLATLVAVLYSLHKVIWKEGSEQDLKRENYEV